MEQWLHETNEIELVKAIRPYIGEILRLVQDNFRRTWGDGWNIQKCMALPKFSITCAYLDQEWIVLWAGRVQRQKNCKGNKFLHPRKNRLRMFSSWKEILGNYATWHGDTKSKIPQHQMFHSTLNSKKLNHQLDSSILDMCQWFKIMHFQLIM